MPLWTSSQCSIQDTVSGISLRPLLTSPQDSCTLSASSRHYPVSVTAPLRTWFQVVWSALGKVHLNPLKPLRAAVQSTGYLAASTPTPLEPPWGEGTLLSSISGFLSALQPPCGHFPFRDWPDSGKYSGWSIWISWPKVWKLLSEVGESNHWTDQTKPLLLPWLQKEPKLNLPSHLG